MKTFCTIISADYAHYVIAQYESLCRHGQYRHQVLCIESIRHIEAQYQIPDGLSFHGMEELGQNSVASALENKYRDTPDRLRWSLKSVWMLHLLESGADQVIFIDPDVYFFANPAFLFDTLGEHAILLSPHWRSTDPEKDPANFEMNFRDGIYNGGFLGATIKGKSALQWIATACLYKCEVTPERGLFVDQRYLDLLHSRFSDVMILSHKGCNVANWNQVDCRRVLVDGQVLINGKEAIVFIHFTKSTILGIQHGGDVHLTPFLLEYQSALRRIQPAYEGPRLPEPAKPKPEKSTLHKSIGKLITRRKP